MKSLTPWTGNLMAWAVAQSEVYSDPVFAPAPPQWLRVPVWFVLLIVNLHSRLLWREGSASQRAALRTDLQEWQKGPSAPSADSRHLNAISPLFQHERITRSSKARMADRAALYELT